MPSMGELLIILAIVLVIFGAGKLPAIGDAFGKTIKNFRRHSKDDGLDEGADSKRELNRGELNRGERDREIDAELVQREVDPARR